MEILKKEARLKGMSLADIAKNVNVTTMTVYGWLAGDFVPRPSNVVALKKLGFSDTACLEPSKEVDV